MSFGLRLDRFQATLGAQQALQSVQSLQACASDGWILRNELLTSGCELEPSNYRARRERIGKLNCVTVRPEGNPTIESVVVLCHGFGASGEDLVGIAESLLDGRTQEGAIEMIFPAAPLALDEYGMPGGRAWWLLSIARLMAALEEGRFEEVREEVPPGIDEARQALTETIELALARNSLDQQQLILGGFSQGAMLSMDVACRGLSEPPAGLCLFSGALICEKHWKANAARLQSTKILQSHGRQDPILPFQAGLWLRQLLEHAGCQVDFVDFQGPHTIPWQAIERLQQLIG